MNRENQFTIDSHCMGKALELAQQALDDNEFPVGCVIAEGMSVVAKGQRTGTASGPGNEIDHAEINAIRHLMDGCPDIDRSALTVYATMEPCLMCFAAILLSGIPRIVYAYEDVMGGGTGVDRTGLSPLYKDAQLTIVAGILRKESLNLFQRFFSRPENRYWSNSRLSRHALSQSISAGRCDRAGGKTSS